MPDQNQPTLLQVDNLSKSFRGLRALDDYHLTLSEGELLGIIGPNGAGKTTLFNLLTGVTQPTTGRVRFNGTDVTGHSPEQIARLGMARTFQNIRLFKPMSVLENVKVALQIQQRAPLWDVLLSLPHFTSSERELTGRARELIHLLELNTVSDAPADSLAYGQQRRLEIACALALSPRLLLLDEPAAGMNPRETEELMRLIESIHHQFDLTIMLIEHNMQVIMGICRRIQALNYGEIIAEGTPAEIRRNSRVIEAYLGETAADA